MAKKNVIAYQVKGTVPIADIPKDGFDSPYAKLLKAVSRAPAGEAVRLQTGSPEEAKKLAWRVYAVGKRSLFVRVPNGSRFVYVGVKAAPPKKRTTKKRGKR